MSEKQNLREQISKLETSLKLTEDQHRAEKAAVHAETGIGDFGRGSRRVQRKIHVSVVAAKGLIKEKPIQLLQRIPADMPAVRGDTMRVRQVLLNLISNASKFTDEGSITVETRVQKGPTGKMEALINVIDTGPGISEEDQEKLFKAFSQVDGSATRKSGGSGLGLSMRSSASAIQT